MLRKLNPKYALAATMTDESFEPSSVTQARQLRKWRAAMCTDFDALQKNGTWSLVLPTPSMSILSNKWVYKIKRRSDGTVECYKARLVANCFHQLYGQDYTKTFSPVVKHTNIRTVLALAMHQKWTVRQLDVQNAFLRGILTEEVYMHQPKRFENSNFPNHVCRLHKSLYGLKQLPRAWF